MKSMKNPSYLVGGPFEPDRIASPGSGYSFGCDEVTSSHVEEIIKQIESVQRFFEGRRRINGTLTSVRYKRVTPKSARIQELFHISGGAYSATVGSRFEEIPGTNGEKLRHVVTYLLPFENLKIAIEQLMEVREILDQLYGSAFQKRFLDKGEKEWQQEQFSRSHYKMPRTTFYKYLADISNIESIFVYLPENVPSGDLLVTFFKYFKAKGELERFLAEIGIVARGKVFDGQNAILTEDQIRLVLDEAPYLIAMTLEDFSSFELEEDTDECAFGRVLPPPGDMPIIGTFDTMYEEGCYLDPYVEFINLTSDAFLLDERNKIHGTKVDSILVEGHMLNPELNDDCGYFRVLHFGVGGFKTIDFATLASKIEECVAKNADRVKVWNISIGDEKGTENNFISLLGAKIDYLSRKYRVLFVVAGTNLSPKTQDPRIGSPADSLNAIVVNSVVKESGKLADYSRRGPVLWALSKPDLCYYGGDHEHPLSCYSPDGNYVCSGTSFAAPFIARKAAYLVCKAGLSVECAKALLIDSALGWKTKLSPKIKSECGYGVPSISIADILETRPDQIKLVISGKTQEQYTLVHDFPILVDRSGSFRFGSKAVFCYFTSGLREQGVDYPCQDVSIEYGLAEKMLCKDKKEHYRIIQPIGKSKPVYQKEEQHIFDFDKWNNTKVIIEGPIVQKRPKDYSNHDPFWGISVTHLDRMASISSEDWKESKDTFSIPFGIVITLKTIDGTDADCEAFIRHIRANEKYRVSEIRVEAHEEILIRGKQEVDWE